MAGKTLQRQRQLLPVHCARQSNRGMEEFHVARSRAAAGRHYRVRFAVRPHARIDPSDPTAVMLTMNDV